MPSSWVETYKTRTGATRYRVKFRLGGRGSRRRHAGSFTRKTDANVRAAWLRTQLAAMQVPDLRLVDPEPDARETVAEAAERWRVSRIDVSEGTAKTYTVNLNRILATLGSLPLDEITTEAVQALVNELHADGEGLDRESIRKTKSTLALVLDFAGVQPNPARDPKVKLPRKEPEEPNPPTAEHVEATLRLLPSLYHLPVLWLDHSGARVGSVDTLTIGDYDETRKRIRARAATTKNRRAIWIDLRPALAEAIEGALPPRYERDLAAPLFPGIKSTALRTAIGRACRAAGVPLWSPHDLRHRRISLLHLRGVPWARIGEFVGQRSLKVTADTYTHVLMDERELVYPQLLTRT